MSGANGSIGTTDHASDARLKAPAETPPLGAAFSFGKALA